MKTKQRVDFIVVLVFISIILCVTSCKSHKNLQPKSTLDTLLQKVAESELKETMQMNKADWGCVVLMDVDSGEIKTMVNLGRDTASDKFYTKSPNYATTKLIEPGQLFTLASIMVCLQDKLINLNDLTFTGTITFLDAKMMDSDTNMKSCTIQHAFEYSSNVAIAKMVTQNYRANPEKFVDHLKEFMLDKPLGLNDVAEPNPVMITPTSRAWCPISLPWLSIGYGIKLTPMQILSFYNAVANNGKLLKPILTKCDTTIIPHVLKDQICSIDALAKTKTLLNGTVNKGAMHEIGWPGMSVAGKGAIVKNYSVKENGNSSLMLCAGYFPADKPKYSYIVAINHYGDIYPNWSPLIIRNIIGYMLCGEKK